MAEVKIYDDDGYVGSLPPFLKMQLRDYFYQNPGPDVQWLCQIAVETGIPVQQFADYYYYVNRPQAPQTEVPLKMDGSNGLVSAMVHTLDQYYLLDSNPSSQAITNIARELDVSKEVVARYFDDRKWNENKDDVDNLLSEVNGLNFQMDDSSNLAEINYLAPVYNSQGQASLSSDRIGTFQSYDNNILEDCNEAVPRVVLQSNVNNLHYLDDKLNSHLELYETNIPPVNYSSHNYGYLFPKEVHHKSYNSDHNPNTLSTSVTTTIPHQVYSQDMSCPYTEGFSINSTLEVDKSVEHVEKMIIKQEVDDDQQSEASLLEIENLQKGLANQYEQAGHSSLTSNITSFSISQIKIETTNTEALGENHVNIKTEPVSDEENQAASLELYNKLNVDITPIKDTKVKHEYKMNETNSQPSQTKKRKSRCRACEQCLAKDCGECVYCLDKPKFGGPNTKKSACLHRRCANLAKLSSKKSSKLSFNLANSVNFSSLSLDNIPFEIEGHSLDTRPPNQSSSPKTSVNSQYVTTNRFNLVSVITPVKSQLKSSENRRNKRKHLSESVDRKTRAKLTHLEVETCVQMGRNGKGSLETERSSVQSRINDSMTESCQVNEVQERLLAIQFDHSYSKEAAYFAHLRHEAPEKPEYENDQAFSGEVLYSVNAAEDFVKTEGLSCPVSIEDDFCEEEFDDEIGPFEDDVSSLFPGDTKSHSTLQETEVRSNVYYQEHYSGVKSIDCQNTTALVSVTDTEELLAEDYDELDSLEKKEIQEQLSEDYVDDTTEDNSETDKVTRPISMFEFGSLDQAAEFLLKESRDRQLFSIKAKLDEVKTDLIFKTGKGCSDRLGSDGNSSPRSEDRSTPSPSNDLEDRSTSLEILESDTTNDFPDSLEVHESDIAEVEDSCISSSKGGSIKTKEVAVY